MRHFCLSLFLCVPLFAGEWSQFRGPNAQGIQDSHPLPVQWSVEKGTGIAAKVEIPGKGHSSAVLTKEHVFLTSALPVSGGGYQVHLFCYERETLQEVWRRSVVKAEGTTYLEHGPRDNSYASSTPVTDGKSVFVQSGYNKGLVAGYLIDGTFLWSAVLGDQSSAYGTGSSPILQDDFLIIVADSERNSSLIVYEKETGKVVWQKKRTSVGSWGTPVIFNAGEDRTAIVVNGGAQSFGMKGKISAYDLKSGEVLWELGDTSSYPCPTPILGEKWIYSSSGPRGPLFAIDPTTKKIQWSLPSAGPYVPTGILYNGLLYIIDDGGVLAAYDPDSGKRKWLNRLVGSGGVHASLVAGDEKLYVATHSGNVFVLEAKRDQKDARILGTNAMGSAINATPAISEGSLYIRNEKTLYRVHSK